MIRCDQHDYLEIACLYGYQLRLILLDGRTVQGQAQDIASRERREYLLLEQDGQRLEIEVERLKSLSVLTPGARFEEIVF